MQCIKAAAATIPYFLYIIPSFLMRDGSITHKPEKKENALDPARQPSRPQRNKELHLILPVCLFCQACAPHLRNKLGVPVDPTSIVGTVSNYMVERYGFSEECVVSAFTGDNQASLAGLCMHPGDLGISLGTSDTVFVWMEAVEGQVVRPQLTGHVWPNPLDSNDYMALIW